MRTSKYHPSPQTLTIPQHLIFDEILRFLPVKSLIRFKSVSKSWFNTISSPEFANLQLQFSSPCSQFLIHPIKNDSEILSLRYNEFNCEIKDMGRLELSHWINRFGVLSLVGSCNGLVCLVCYCMLTGVRFFVVWNPVTNQFRRIDFPYDETNVETYGCSFGYSSSKNGYILFAVFWFRYSETARSYMFSWSTGEWKLFGNLSNHFSTFVFRDVLLIDDVVYLLFYDYIVGFNLANEEINESPTLDWPETYWIWSGMQLRGCLSFICSANEIFSDVWMLKRHCEWNSWEKVFSVNFTSVVYCGISEAGKCLVFHKGKLKVVDLSRGSGTYELSWKKGIDFDDNPGTRFVAQGYVESLVSPF